MMMKARGDAIGLRIVQRLKVYKGENVWVV